MSSTMYITETCEQACWLHWGPTHCCRGAVSGTDREMESYSHSWEYAHLQQALYILYMYYIQTHNYRYIAYSVLSLK